MILSRLSRRSPGRQKNIVGTLQGFQQDIVIYECRWICSRVWHSLHNTLLSMKFTLSGSINRRIRHHWPSFRITRYDPLWLLFYSSRYLHRACISTSTKCQTYHISLSITWWQAVTKSGKLYVNRQETYRIRGVALLDASRAVYHGPHSLDILWECENEIMIFIQNSTHLLAGMISPITVATHNGLDWKVRSYFVPILILDSWSLSSLSFAPLLENGLLERCH